MSGDAWAAVVMALVGLLAVYFLPRESQKKPPKTHLPKLMLVERKRMSWTK